MRAKKDPTKKRFEYESEYGTAQQRLADAIAMGGKDVNRLFTVLNYMGGNYASPQEVEMAQGFTPNIYDNSPDPNMDMRLPSYGRVFQTTPGALMRVQTESDDPRYDYINEGGPLRANNIGALTGYEGPNPSSRDAKVLNELLKESDFVRYFTDIYESADPDFRPIPKPKGRDMRPGETDWTKGVVWNLPPMGDPVTGYTGRQLRQKNRCMHPSCKKMHNIGIFGRQKKR